MGCEESPVSHHDAGERDPLHSDRPHAQQEQKRVAQANLRERILKREIGLALAIERRKTPRKIRTSDRQTAWAVSFPGIVPGQPAGQREGQATPTRNENHGWIVSWTRSQSTPRGIGDGKERPRCHTQDPRQPGKTEHLGHHQEHHEPAIGVDRSQPPGW